MARDPNLFKWQAFVYTAAILSVALIAITFLIWRQNSDLNKRLDSANANLQSTTSQFQESEGRVKRLLAMLGEGEYSKQDMDNMAAKYANDAVLKDVEVKFSEAENLFSATEADNEKNLFRLAQSLLETIRQRNEQIQEARDREEQLKASMTQTLQRESKASEDAMQAKRKAEDDLQKTRAAHMSEITRLNKEKEDALGKFDTYKTEMDRKYAAVSAFAKRLEGQVAKQAETIAAQSIEINQFRNPDFAAPQGKIVRTDKAGKRIWIDLGSEDGLRVGVPFTILDANSVRASDAKQKAKVLITAVVGEHLAVGEAVDYRYTDPIVTGDLVYSPVWRPGRKVGFALVGLMDVNDDRKDDLSQVIQLIEQAGGKVDSYLD